MLIITRKPGDPDRRSLDQGRCAREGTRPRRRAYPGLSCSGFAALRLEKTGRTRIITIDGLETKPVSSPWFATNEQSQQADCHCLLSSPLRSETLVVSRCMAVLYDGRFALVSVMGTYAGQVSPFAKFVG